MARWLGRHPFTVDALIALTAVGALLLDVAWARPSGGARIAAIGFAAVMGGSLGWRRYAPLSSYAVGTAALALQAVFVYTSELYPYVNLLGSTRRRCTRPAGARRWRSPSDWAVWWPSSAPTTPPRRCCRC